MTVQQLYESAKAIEANVDNPEPLRIFAHGVAQLFAAPEPHWRDWKAMFLLRALGPFEARCLGVALLRTADDMEIAA